MALQNTIKHMRELLAAISVDLEKAVNGNKAASQRVRTGTIKLEKIAKEYRKHSVAEEKKQGPRRSQAQKAHVAKKKAQPKKAEAKTVKARAHAKSLRKAPAKKTHHKKRSTAKIPVKGK